MLPSTDTIDTQGVWSVSDQFLTNFWLISGPESNSHGDGRPQERVTPQIKRGTNNGGGGGGGGGGGWSS